MGSRQPTDLPEPDFDDPKELYAFFGLASYEAQLLEMSFINLAVALKFSDGVSMYRDIAMAAFGDMEEKTFGQLLKAVAPKVPGLAHAIELFRDALRKRNYLVHDFFREHSADLLTDQGRRQMILELRDLAGRFQEADVVVDRLWRSEWARHGFSDVILDREFKRMLVEVGNPGAA